MKYIFGYKKKIVVPDLLALFHFNNSINPDNLIAGATFTPTINMSTASIETLYGKFGKGIFTTKYSSPSSGINFSLALPNQYKKIQTDFWAQTFDGGYTYAFSINLKQTNANKNMIFSASCYYSSSNTPSKSTNYGFNNGNTVLSNDFGLVGGIWSHMLVSYDVDTKKFCWFIDGIKVVEQTVDSQLEYVDNIEIINQNASTEGYTDELRIMGGIAQNENFAVPTAEYQG